MFSKELKEACGGLQRENPGAFLNFRPVFPGRFSFPENAQTLAGIALARRHHPNSWKNAPRMQGQMKSFMWVPSLPGIAPGVAPRIVFFALLKSCDAMPRIGLLIPRICFELRELLQEYPGTLPQLRKWPFHSESVFPLVALKRCDL